MIRLIHKIIAVTVGCLLVLNLASGAAVAAGNCSSRMSASMVDENPMEMGHCDGLLNFGLPPQKCCDECSDIFCDLMNDHLQDAHAVNILPLQKSVYPFLLGAVCVSAEPGTRISRSKPRFQFPSEPSWNLIPLYIENLSLII